MEFFRKDPFPPRTREKSVRERAQRNACISVVSSSARMRRSHGFRTRSICSWYLGRFPNSKTLLSFFARARKHLSLSLVKTSTFARSTPCFAASLSFHVNQLASWLGWTGLCWRILYTVKRHRYLVQDNFYVRRIITPNVRCLVHFCLSIFLLLASSLQTSLRPHYQCKIALVASDPIKLCRYRT